MEQEFLEKLQDVMGCEETLTMDMDLTALDDWDSFSMVAFIAMLNCDYNKRVEQKTVVRAKTVGDLYKLVQ